MNRGPTRARCARQRWPCSIDALISSFRRANAKAKSWPRAWANASTRSAAMWQKCDWMPQIRDALQQRLRVRLAALADAAASGRREQELRRAAWRGEVWQVDVISGVVGRVKNT